MVLRRNYKLHSSLRRADYVTTTTTTEFTLKIFRMVQVLARVSFQNHWQIFCLFEELLHLLTLSHVHNGPQVNPTTSGFPLNSNNHELHTTAPIQWRKKRKLKSNQVDLSSDKFHSHSEGKRKQNLSRIIKAQGPSLSDFSFN